MRTSHGWRETDEETKESIVAAAKRFLEGCESIAGNAFRKEPDRILNDVVMAAFFLLLELEPEYLESKPTPWWEHWVFYIMREPHYHLAGEEGEPKRKLVRTVYRKAGEKFLSNLISIAKNKNRRQIISDFLEIIEDMPDPELDDILLGLVRDKSVRGSALLHIMEFCLHRSPAEARKVCLSRLAITSPNRANVPSVHACVAMIRKCPDETWDQIMNFLEKRRDLAKLVFFQYTHFGYRRGYHENILLMQDAKKLERLIHLLFEIYPPVDDPKHEGAAIDFGNELRNGVMNTLIERGTPIALDALESLEKRFQSEYPWLRGPRSLA